MKRFVNAALCLTLVICMMVSLAACGGGVAGRYNLASMEMGGQELDVESLKAMAGTDVDMYIELNEDGTAVMNMLGETTELEYDDTHMWPVSNKDDRMPYTIDGSSLILEQDGVKVVFKK